jgi:hypothetical protein
LSIVLDGGTTATGRLAASFAGLVALSAATHLYGKSVYLFDLYEGFIEDRRQQLQRPGLQTDDLRSVRPFPANTLYEQRRWWDEKTWRHKVFVKRRSAIVWLVALLILIGLDALLFVYSAYGVFVKDPGWFSQGT